jgi:hypothetical protein
LLRSVQIEGTRLKYQWLLDPSVVIQENWRKARRQLRKTKREYLKDKMNELE